MAVVTVAFEDLDTWLQNQPDNTVDTPYELNITGLIASDIGASTASGTLGNIIRNNSTKYVDLRSTSLPSGITEINSLFLNCVALVYSPSIPTSVTSFSKAFQNSSLKLVPTLHEGITVLKWAFENTLITVCPELPSTVTDISSMCYKCYNLVTPPSVIPESVTHMNLTFAYCSLIVNPPLFPSNVFYVEKTYRGCTSLAYKPIIPSYMSTTATATYLDVPTKNWKGTEIQVRNFIKTNECQSLTGYFEIQNADNNDLIYCTDLTNYYNLNGHFSKSGTYYILYVGITASNFRYIKENTSNLASNLPKAYSDLSYTVIPNNLFSGTDLEQAFYGTYGLVASPVLPEGITSLKETFKACQSLVKFPTIPSTVTDLTCTFESCWRLRDRPTIPSGVTTMVRTFYECFHLCYDEGIAPVIPNGVTTIQDCFYDCNDIVEVPELPNSITNMNSAFATFNNWEGSTSLKKVANIPSSVTSAICAFADCYNLEKIEQFGISASNLDSTNFEGMFKNCNSLTSIGYKVDEADQWHAFRLKFGNDTVEGKIYDTAGNYVEINEGTAVSITKSTLTLPVKTDELWFPDMTDPDFDTDAKIDAIIEKVLQYKYSYFKKKVLQPDKKSFVMWADDPDNFQTNLEMGGGSYDFSRQGAYCDTDGSIANKTAKMIGFAEQTGQIFPITFANDNTYDGALTLSINNTTAYPLYINGSVSSSSNKTLPAGTYLIRFAGDVYYLETTWGAPYARYAEHSDTVVGVYTGSGGQQNPQYVGKNRVRFNMMNTTINGNSQYKDFALMDCYAGHDVGGAVGIGVSRQSMRVFAMRSDAGTSPNRPTSWANTCEINTSTYTQVPTAQPSVALNNGAIWVV